MGSRIVLQMPTPSARRHSRALRLLGILPLLVCCVHPAIASAADAPVSHIVPSEFQAGAAEIRVVLPSPYRTDAVYRTLYVLPVEAGFGTQFGDPLAILQAMDFPTASGFVCVMVGYATPPWFGDHPTEPTQQQGRHLVERVIPFVDGRYAVGRRPADRFLLGFSKSGWGAGSLLMRHPDRIGYAGAWDAPWCMDGLVWGLRENFGTQAAMDADRPDLLVPKVATRFQGAPRLVVAGEQAWGSMRPLAGGDRSRTHTVAFHELLTEHRFAHVYDNSLAFPHRWDERWMRPVLQALIRLADAQRKTGAR